MFVHCIWKYIRTFSDIIIFCDGQSCKKTNASAKITRKHWIKSKTVYSVPWNNTQKQQPEVWTNKLTVDVAVIKVQRGWGHTPGNKYCMAGMLTYKEKLRQSTKRLLNKSWKGWLKVMNATGRKRNDGSKSNKLEFVKVQNKKQVVKLTRVDVSRHNRGFVVQSGFCSRHKWIVCSWSPI